MAVNLSTTLDPKFVHKVLLQICDPADDARIDAGRDWLYSQEIAALEETRDGYLVAFRSAERPWRAEFLPQKLRLYDVDELPDFVPWFPGGGNDYCKAQMVSPRLKSLIAAHQSDKDGWQFFPVEVLNKDDTLYGTYYIWGVHRIVDAIDETSEGMKTVAGPVDGRHRWTFTGAKGPERLKLKKSVIDGLNAWIDFRFQPFTQVFVSDVLMQAMQDAGISFVDFDTRWSEI